MKKRCISSLLLVLALLLALPTILAEDPVKGNVTKVNLSSLESQEQAAFDPSLLEIEPYAPEGMDKAIIGADDRKTITNVFKYFPFDNPALYQDLGQDVLGTQAGYGYFSQQMAKMWMGKALIDWSVLDQLQVQAREAGVRVKLPLSMPQAQGLTQAKLRVLEKLADDAFAYLHTTQDFYLDPTEGLDLFYPYQALYMVDAEGRRLTSPLSYFQQDEALVLYGMLQKEEFKGPGDIIAAVLEYRKDQQGIYQLAQVRESSQNPALQGKPTLRLGDWHSLLVMRAVMSPARDGEGRMQAIRHWPVHPDYIALQPLALKDASFRPQFLTLENSGELYFMLEITDIQNKVVCTELMPLAPAQ